MLTNLLQLRESCILYNHRTSGNPEGHRHGSCCCTSRLPSANRPITKRFDRRVSRFLRGKERFGHSCGSSPLLCGSRNGSTIPSRENLVSSGTKHSHCGGEASSRPIQGEQTDYCEYSSVHMLVFPEWKISYGKHLEGPHNALGLNPCAFATRATGSYLTERQPN